MLTVDGIMVREQIITTLTTVLHHLFPYLPTKLTAQGSGNHVTGLGLNQQSVCPKIGHFGLGIVTLH